MRAKKEGTSTETLLFAFNNLCVTPGVCVGSGENARGEAQLPLSIPGLAQAQGQAANGQGSLRTSPCSQTPRALLGLPGRMEEAWG